MAIFVAKSPCDNSRGCSVITSSHEISKSANADVIGLDFSSNCHNYYCTQNYFQGNILNHDILLYMTKVYTPKKNITQLRQGYGAICTQQRKRY